MLNEIYNQNSLIEQSPLIQNYVGEFLMQESNQESEFLKITFFCPNSYKCSL
ncbi:hypothetical protein [Mycoplasmopsis gallinacea]|uniref:Uncharacterized protein n=1 Tax=Mycoplasmopsis gallinacea TaxID=29556 RepID=A0A449A2N2_9BACT|nr:hypothetical protein [Mycoplasmopsis gallinacea]VEU58511.1 Uncharacterised protein [Mycoplasmopsis gallinacea]